MSSGRRGSRTLSLRSQSSEAGFTLIELLVVMVIMTVLSGLSVTGWVSHQRKAEHKSTANQVVSVMRNAQQAAYAEAVAYCIQFDTASTGYRVYKRACGAAGQLVGGTKRTQGSRVTFTSASFKQSDGTLASSVTFTPRGTASKGTLEITSSVKAKRYIISVEGLTGRVSLN